MSIPTISTATTRRRVWTGAAGVTAAVAGGVGLAYAPLLSVLAVAAAGTALLLPFVDGLCVLMFWTLPYMSLNTPGTGFTLKLCDVMAYLFAVVWAARAVLRRQRVDLPPATVQVALFLAACCLSAVLAPAVPLPYLGNVDTASRNAPDVRPLSLVVWLAVAWLVVCALYDCAGRSPALLRRCVRGHILGALVACAISLVMYALGLLGMQFTEATGHHLIFNMGGYLRLAGVAYEPTFLGFYLTTTIPITLAMWRTKPDWMPPRVTGLSLLLQSVAMLLTFSSGGFGSLLVALLCLALLLGWWRVPVRTVAKAALRVTLLGAAVVALASVVFLSQPKLVQRLLTDTFGKIAQGGDDIRKREWQVGRGIISDYPVTGVGPGLARFYFPRYHERVRSQPLDMDLEVNSLYLNTLAEEGVVGMAALIGVGVAGLAGLALPLLRFGPSRTPILAALTASLVGCAAHYTAFNSLFLVYFTALVGLALAAARVARLENEPQRADIFSFAPAVPQEAA